MSENKSIVIPSFATENLAFGFTERKFVISRRKRPELPHLTLSWGNASQEIDLHLTYPRSTITPDGHPAKVYESLIRVHPRDFEPLAPTFDRCMREGLLQLSREGRFYRPGWLERRGYCVTLQREAEVLEWVKTLAPKRRGKHRIDFEDSLAVERLPTFFYENTYRAGVLRLIDPVDILSPLPAFRVVRGRFRTRDDLMLSYRRGSDGRVGWWGLRQCALRRFSATLSKTVDELVRRHAYPRHRIAFEQVVEALVLEELPSWTHVISSIRALLGPAQRRVS